MDHMSTGLPCPSLRMTSGAAYPKDPAIVFSDSPLPSSILAIPKSARTRSESGSFVRYRRFSGLRSKASGGQLCSYHASVVRTSVDDLVPVEEIDSKEDLLNGLGGILLGEFPLLANSVEELSADSELSNNVELVLRGRQHYADIGRLKCLPSTRTSPRT